MKPRRLNQLAAALWIAAALWLFVTADSLSESMRLFGRWRVRDFLFAIVAGWFGLAFFLGANSRRTLLKLILSTIGLSIAWMLLETAALLGLVDAHAAFRPKPSGLGARAIPNLDQRGVTQEDLAMRYGFPGREVEFHFKTDRYGFRNHLDRESASLYLLGDSILVAGLLPHEDLIATKLEATLDEPVMNLALTASAPHRQRDYLKEMGPDLRNRMLLQFVFEGNDLIDKEIPREEVRLDWRERSVLQNLITWIQRKTDQDVPFGKIGEEDFLFYWLRNSFAGSEDRFERVMSACSEIREYVEERGGRYGIVLVPAKIRVLGPLCEWPEDSSLDGYEDELNPMLGWVRDWCEKQDVPLIDVTATLAAQASEGNFPWFAADTHPNAVGHAAMAAAILEWDFVKTWQADR